MRIFKRILCFILLIAVCACFFGCTNNAENTDKTAGTVFKIGESSLYTEDDRNAAVDVIIERINRDGYIDKLYTVEYAGDELSEETKKYVNSLEEAEYNEAVLFYIDFHTRKGAEKTGLSGDYNYTDYKVTLAKNEQGEWIVIEGACGYA